MKKLKIEKYCSEINWEEVLEPNCVNLVCAPTGSGKSTVFLNMASSGSKIAYVAPFVSITNQIKLNHPEMELKTGTKAGEEEEVFANGRITSFHSIPKMLELKEVDLLVIDEIHVLSQYAGYTKGMLTVFANTITELRKKHPNMKIVALTGTPQFIKMYEPLNFHLIEVEAKQALSKPVSIKVATSWTKDLPKETSYLYLYASRKQGMQQAKKYHGEYIDSASKDRTQAYVDLLAGRMSASRLFTSTVLATGISIIDPVKAVYTNWPDLVTIAQIAARPRAGGHILYVTKTVPFFMRGGVQRPVLDWTGDFELDMRLLHRYETYYAYKAHSGGINQLKNIIHQMIWLPMEDLPFLDDEDDDEYCEEEESTWG